MATAAITFDELERNSEVTKGYALLAKNARSMFKSIVLMGLVSNKLDLLMASLAPEKLELLSEENTSKLVRDLQDLHSLLAEFSCWDHRSGGLLVRGFVQKVQDSTEDLGDVIEDLVLSQDKEFRTLLSECVQRVSAPVMSEPIGQM